MTGFASFPCKKKEPRLAAKKKAVQSPKPRAVDLKNFPGKMRLHDAVRYALYVSREIGGARATRFGAQRKVKLSPAWNERDARYVLQNAALDVITRILNFGFDGSGALRRPIDQGGLNLVGRGAVLSLIVRVMGGTQDREDDVYGVNAPGARSNLEDLIERMWKYMRLVKKRDTDPGTAAVQKSNGLVDAVEMLLRKFYVGAHLQRHLQSESESGGIVVVKPRVGDAHYAEKKKAWDTFIVPLTDPYDAEFTDLYTARMGLLIAPKERRSKGEAAATEPSAKKRRPSRPLHVVTYDHLASIVVHDAFVISTETQTAQTVVLGKEPLEAIVAATTVEMDDHDALAIFILDAIATADAKPLVVVCSAHSVPGQKNKAMGYEYNPPGDDDPVGAFVIDEVEKGGPTDFLSSQKYTHVALVVDARSVESAALAVAFWKTNKRGLNFIAEGEHEAAWVTVIIAPEKKIVAPSNAVVIGTVELGALPAASVSCNGKKQYNRKALSVRGLRTYGGDLKVTNVVTIPLDAVGLARLAASKCTETKIRATVEGDDEERVSALQIAVIDAREIGVTSDNIDHFMALGTMRNYIMLTTKEQHGAVGRAEASDRQTIQRVARKRGGANAAVVQGADDAELNAKVAVMRAAAKEKRRLQGEAQEGSDPEIRARALESMRAGEARRANEVLAEAAIAAKREESEREKLAAVTLGPFVRRKLAREALAKGSDDAAKATMGKRGGKNIGALEELRELGQATRRPEFESETVTILKMPVMYMNSEECEMAKREEIQSAIRDRKAIAVTFLLVRVGQPGSNLRHHGSVARTLKKKPIHGTLFYVECTASAAGHTVSFEMVTGGVGKNRLNVSETMDGRELPMNLDAVEAKYATALSTWNKANKQTRGKAPARPHVYVLCR